MSGEAFILEEPLERASAGLGVDEGLACWWWAWEGWAYAGII